jgi:hypothetical protein
MASSDPSWIEELLGRLITKTDAPYKNTGPPSYSRPDDPTQIPGKLQQYDEQDRRYEERRKTGLPDPYPRR